MDDTFSSEIRQDDQDERSVSGAEFPPPAVPSGRRATQQEQDGAFADTLLEALTAMALRSKRRQADVSAAMRGAGLIAEPRSVRAALRLLQAQGVVENLVPLSDGGLLLSVARTPAERYETESPWLPRGDSDDAEPSPPPS